MKHLLLLLSSLSLPVVAAEPTAIETLIITAKTQSVGGVRQLNAAELMPGIRNDAAEWLAGIAGVQVDSRSNYAQDTRVTLRGFGARSAFGVRGVDLQIDGIPLSMPDGQGQFSGAVLDAVSQVTVVTGPVAALYGNAAGGVINVQSSAPAINRLILGGAMDEAGLERQQLLGEWRQGEFALRAQANRMDAQGERPHANARREQFGLQAYYHFDNGVQAQWRFDNENAPLLQDPLGLTRAQWQENPNQANSSAELFNTRKDIDHRQYAVSLRKSEGEQRWQLAAWGGERHIQQYLAQKGDAISNSGGVVDLSRDFAGANGNYTWDIDLVRHPASVTLGGEWAAMDDRRKGYVNNNGTAGDLRRNELGQVDSRDGYALLQWQLTDGWHWLAGLRHSHLQFVVDDYFILPKNGDDSGERHFHHLVKTLATDYKLTEHWVLRAALGNGFETPTLTETAYTSGDRGFNQTLDAAVNWQHEIGLDYRANALVASLAAYQVNTRDEIVVDQALNGRTSYRNAAATERKGLEFSGRYEWSGHFNARFSASYLDAIYSEGQWQDRQLPGIARLNEYLQLNWRPWANDVLNVGFDIVHRAAIATNDDNQLKAPAYTDLDVSLAGRFVSGSDTSSHWQSGWWVKLANVENKKYVGSVIVNQIDARPFELAPERNIRAFEPAPGRNLSAGIRVDRLFE